MTFLQALRKQKPYQIIFFYHSLGHCFNYNKIFFVLEICIFKYISIKFYFITFEFIKFKLSLLKYLQYKL